MVAAVRRRMLRSMGKLVPCASLSLLLGLVGCANDDDPKEPNGEESSALTYWDDMAPLFAEHCVACHQAGGIGPFRLDDYASAKQHAAEIQVATASRAMPPWGATSDGSCQTFEGSLALSDEQIAQIGQWISGGAREGEPRTIDVPARPKLDGDVVYETPKFVAEAVGGELAAHDEYRCFLFDSGVTEDTFITAYEVTAGAPEIVHHSILWLVDPDAPDSEGAGTNLERMQALDDESPDRPGWPCFSAAGEGVEVSSNPVVWAPGQGVVAYPAHSGAPLRAKDKAVIQIHYNLADVQGLEDQTRITLRTQPLSELENIALFPLVDPFLDSIRNSKPEQLAPGKSSVKFSWQRSIPQIGLSGVPELRLRGVMPHMHELGHKYRMNLVNGGTEACGIDVQSWDFHWQRMYFYEQPIPLTEQDAIQVTCDFDTSSKSSPVLPGWGTQNEMCLATLFVTVPIATAP